MHFPASSNNQQVIQICHDELIYSIHSITSNNSLSTHQSVPMNEHRFWETLSNSAAERSYVTIYPNQSFYSTRLHRNSFNPKLSLLKLGGKQVTRHCTPSLLRADGPGAIFPLSSASHRLFSIDYHHEGGNRQWYIIPATERSKLEQIIRHPNSSTCLEHQNFLIDPSVLEKYHIRYHRVIQHPKEFVVLAAGALAQGFAENTSWNESIVFALPSWLEDGHAIAQRSPCHCNPNNHSFLEPIDINPFRYELVQ